VDAYRDPAGTRTQDPNIKSVVLYQLSYEINFSNYPAESQLFVFGSAKIAEKGIAPNFLKKNHARFMHI
jgi:hypothetical protein